MGTETRTWTCSHCGQTTDRPSAHLCNEPTEKQPLPAHLRCQWVPFDLDHNYWLCTRCGRVKNRPDTETQCQAAEKKPAERRCGTCRFFAETEEAIWCEWADRAALPWALQRITIGPVDQASGLSCGTWEPR